MVTCSLKDLELVTQKTEITINGSRQENKEKEQLSFFPKMEKSEFSTKGNETTFCKRPLLVSPPKSALINNKISKYVYILIERETRVRNTIFDFGEKI